MASSYVRLNFNLSDEEYKKLLLLQKHYSNNTKKMNITELLKKFINDDWNNKMNQIKED